MTMKISRLRSGNGAPLSVVIGTATAAASDTAPRNPAQAVTKRCRQPTRRSRCTARRSISRISMVVNSPQKMRDTITTR